MTSSANEKARIALKHAQGQIFNDRTRFKVVVTGRRFGKTFGLIADLLRGATERPGELFFYVAPTYKMAKSIAWEPMKAMIPKRWWAKKPNETELSIKLVNGSIIELKGAENPDSLVGRSVSGAALDEAALYQDEKVWRIALRPSLSDKQGWATFATTIRRGFRAQWFLDLYEKAQKDEDPAWKAWTFTTLDGENVPPEEIELAKGDMDEQTFNQEYLAILEDDFGRVAVSFSGENIKEVEDDTALSLHIGIDFNVDPFCAVVAVKKITWEGNQAWENLYIFNELELKDATTWDMAETLHEIYGEKRRKVAFPDPTGNARKTSGVGLTDHAILRKAGIKVVSPKRAWRIRDKVAAINTGLKDATGRRRIFIHPRCTSLIKSLRNLTYDEKTGLPEKKQGLDHMFDALGYLCLSTFNLAKPAALGTTMFQTYGKANDAEEDATRTWEERESGLLVPSPTGNPLLLPGSAARTPRASDYVRARISRRRFS